MSRDKRYCLSTENGKIMSDLEKVNHESPSPLVSLFGNLYDSTRLYGIFRPIYVAHYL